MVRAALVLVLAACGARERTVRHDSAQADAGVPVQPPSSAAVAAAHGARMSPHQFVERFYDWYVPRAGQSGAQPAWTSALSVRAADLNPDLARALREDADAQAHAAGEIVGIDADPFLGGQDPCERYEVGAARPDAAGYAVEVYGVCGGKRHDAPDVVAEIAAVGDSWQFVNFRYPAVHSDLRRALQQARDDRGAAVR
ncbi:MAG TPA: hypothetical protein VGD56_09955 [Gemmatirosa sp.]